MASARSDEIKKLKEGVTAGEQRIASMDESLKQLQDQAESEKERLQASQGKLEKKIEKLRQARSELTSKVDQLTLRKYERIRKRLGGIAFVSASRERCSACKMVIPHQMYTILMRGEEIVGCENCGRLLYWLGHFKTEETDGSGGDEDKGKSKAKKAKPKAAKKAKSASGASVEQAT